MRQTILLMGAIFLLCCFVPTQAFLVNNGSFDEDAADWGADGGGGLGFSWSAGHEIEDGDGYVTLTVTPGSQFAWAVWYQIINEELTEWGLPDGTTITLSADIREITGGGNLDSVALKIEAWDDDAVIPYIIDDVEVFFTVTTEWENYSLDFEIPAGTTSLKCVLVNVPQPDTPTAGYGYNNVKISVPEHSPALKPVPVVGDPLLPAVPILSWTNPDPNNPGDTITADVFILESDVFPIADPNLGPVEVDPGVVQVASGTPDQWVDLHTAGYPLQSEKYYYWAVHITDPSIGVIEGFTWHFNTFDAPPTSANAGDDQYLWLGMGDNPEGEVTFTLSGSVVDDGKSPLTLTWSLDVGLTETDPATTVTIHNPEVVIDEPVDGINEHTTTVTVDNTGWFYFVLTAEDAVGSTSAVVNVGVYADACEAAYADPADEPLLGDLTGDCKVGLADLAIMASNWLACMSEKLDCTPTP